MKYEKYFDEKLKRNCWRFDFTICGRRIRRGGFDRKSTAENVVAAIRLTVQKHQYELPMGPPGYTLDDLLKKIEADDRIAGNRTLVFRQFVEWKESPKEIYALRRSDLAKYLMHLRDRKLKDSTISLYLDHISSFLNAAGEYFPEMEDYRPPRFPKRPRGEARRRVLAKEELAKFFAVMSRPSLPNERSLSEVRLKLFDVARLMLLTGARKEEILKVTPERINYDTCILTLRSSKTKTEHQVALNMLAIEILKKRGAQTPEEKKLFEGVGGWHITRIFENVAEIAGSNYGQQIPGGWSLHDFRRTAATVIEDAGIPYSAVAAQLGHKRPDMTARYTVAQTETMRRAAQILADWCRDIDGFLEETRAQEGSQETTPQTAHA